MLCQRCGCELPDDSVFCGMCGARVDGKKLCKFCKAEIAEDTVFCVKCGRRVDGKKPCKVCGAELDERTVFCTKCGADQRAQRPAAMPARQPAAPGARPARSVPVSGTIGGAFARLKEMENSKHFIYNLMILVLSSILFLCSFFGMMKVDASSLSSDFGMKMPEVEISQSAIQVIEAGLFTKGDIVNAKKQLQEDLQKAIDKLPDSIVNKLNSSDPTFSEKELKTLARVLSGVNWIKYGKMIASDEVPMSMLPLTESAIINLLMMLMSFTLMLISGIGLLTKKKFKGLAFLAVLPLALNILYLPFMEFDGEYTFWGAALKAFFTFSIILPLAMLVLNIVFGFGKMNVKLLVKRGVSMALCLLVFGFAFGSQINIKVMASNGKVYNGGVGGTTIFAMQDYWGLEEEQNNATNGGSSEDWKEAYAQFLKSVQNSLDPDTGFHLSQKRGALVIKAFAPELIANPDMIALYPAVLTLMCFLPWLNLLTALGALAVFSVAFAGIVVNDKEKRGLKLSMTLVMVGMLVFSLVSVVFSSVGAILINDGIGYLVEEKLIQEGDFRYFVGAGCITSAVFALILLIFRGVFSTGKREDEDAQYACATAYPPAEGYAPVQPIYYGQPVQQAAPVQPIQPVQPVQPVPPMDQPHAVQLPVMPEPPQEDEKQ